MECKFPLRSNNTIIVFNGGGYYITLSVYTRIHSVIFGYTALEDILRPWWSGV